MLDVKLAEKIIDKLTECTDYNINIMNERGIVIASKDKSRVGTFHEVAFEIINKKLEFKEVEAEDTFLGVKAGINMALEYKKDIIGVLGITGKSEEVRPVAIVIKKMVETMLEYEAQRADSQKRSTDKEHFINSLLYEDLNKRELLNMAKPLGYSNVARIPILISFQEPVEIEKMAEKVRGGIRKEGTRDDIFVINREGKILVFKSYSEPLEGFFENYKYVIGEYLGRFLRHVAENEIACKICVGSVQTSMSHYKYAYQHCLWLEEAVAAQKRSLFFYDYLDEYLKNQLPFLELHKVFDVFSDQYTEEFKQMYTEHIGALYQNNYSMQESSKRLYIHKNTLAFRLDKIKHQLGLNPMQNARDRELVNYFYYYLKQLS